MMKRTLFLPLALLLAAATLTLAACSGQTAGKAGAATELVKTDTKVGDGAEAAAGNTVAVHYTGWLYDEKMPDHKGKQFDSSRIRNQPFEFQLGAGRVIRGWDQGVQGMKVGGQRTLVIPANLGYGPIGAGEAIPPFATLIFDIELVAIK